MHDNQPDAGPIVRPPTDVGGGLAGGQPDSGKRIQRTPDLQGPVKDWIKSFKVPIYDHSVKFVVTQDMKGWCEKYPDRMGSTRVSEAFFVPEVMDADVELIVVQPDITTDILAHEIGHCARYIMEFIGFKIKAKNDEPLAYLEGFLTKKIHKIIKNIPDAIQNQGKKGRKGRHRKDGGAVKESKEVPQGTECGGTRLEAQPEEKVLTEKQT